VYYHGGCFVSGGFATHDNQLRQLAWFSGCRVIAYTMVGSKPLLFGGETTRKVMPSSAMSSTCTRVSVGKRDCFAG
jgi:hypothetical protein